MEATNVLLMNLVMSGSYTMICGIIKSQDDVAQTPTACRVLSWHSHKRRAAGERQGSA